MLKPQAKNFHTNDGMHAAMRDWANAQAKPEMQVTVIYDDSPDPFVDVFERVTKEVKYKTLDGEIYTVSVDTGKFVNSYMLAAEGELTASELKKAFAEWAHPTCDGVSIASIKWEKVK